MIQRVVVLKLKPEYANDADRAQVVEHTREVLPKCPQVRDLRVAAATDGRTKREWDITILVQLDDLDAVEEYRVDAIHRAYVDVYLKPLMASIRAWNFELDV